MARIKMLFCHHCFTTTPHQYLGKESVCEGTGPVRVIAALATLGMTETVLAEKYWQCQRCGNVTQEH